MEREESVLGCTAWVKRRLAGAWSAATVGTQLTPATLDNLAECFRNLESTVKTRVLLGLLSLRYRDVERLSAHILPVLERADEDADEWVKTICHLARQYVTTGVIDPTDSLGSSVLAAAIRSIESVAPEQSHYLPVSVRYLNPSVLPTLSSVASAVDPVDSQQHHFTLKKQPARTPRVAADAGPSTGSHLRLNSLNVDAKHGTGFGLTPHRRISTDKSGSHSRSQAKATTRREFLVSRGLVAPKPPPSSIPEADEDEDTRKRKNPDHDAEPDLEHGSKRLDDGSAAAVTASASEPAYGAYGDAAMYSGVSTDSSTPTYTAEVTPNPEHQHGASEGGAGSGGGLEYPGLGASEGDYGERAHPTTGAGAVDGDGYSSTAAPTDPGYLPSAPMELEADPREASEADHAVSSMGSTAANPYSTSTNPYAPSSDPSSDPYPPAPAVGGDDYAPGGDGTVATEGQPTSADQPPPAENQPPADPALSDVRSTVFQQANRLQPADRARIEAFLDKTAVLAPGGRDVQQVVLHEEKTPQPDGTTLVEQVVFEMTFSSMQWRRLRRKRTVRPQAV
eukprot:m.17422 g.17422  ORF g.17422 m.17422 type:complete len:565 (+) comp5186_c0_seq1:176-1870(+)